MSCGKRMLAVLMAVCLCLSVTSMTLAAAAKKKAAKEAAPAAAPAEPEKLPSIEDAFKALPAYEFGQSRLALTAISNAVRDSAGKQADRAKIVDQLTAALAGKATTDAKRFICRELSIAGTAKEVPALAALLADKDLSDMARYALERIPDPAAVAAMEKALPGATGNARIGLINSLGMRQAIGAVPALVAALADKDAAVASAAAAALGRIGGPEAAKALAAARGAAAPELKLVISDAYLQCADKLLKDKNTDEAVAIYDALFQPTEVKQVRVAALRGLVAAGGPKAEATVAAVIKGTDKDLQAAALRFQREIPTAAKIAIALTPDLPPATQVMILDDMAARGDAAALPQVVKAAESQDESVKLAAVRALGKLGNASTLALLVPLAAGKGPVADEAQRSLDRLPAADVNAALAGMIDKGDPAAKAQVIRALGARRVTAATAAVMKATEDADAAIRLAAIQALDVLADEKCVPALVALVAKAKGEAEMTAVEKTLGSLASRAADKDAAVAPILAAIPAAAMPAKAGLIRCLARAGGAKALAAVCGLVKDADTAVQDASVRALADWSDAAAAAELMNLAKTAAKPTHAVLALRGYIRLAGTDAVAAGDKLKMYKDALAVAKRTEEKTAAIGGLGNLKSVAALKVVDEALADEAVKEAAASAAVKLAKALGAGGKDQIKITLPKVIAATKNAGIKKDAEELLKAAGAAAAPAREIRIYAAAKPTSAAAEAIGWRLATQAYSFNRYTFAEAVEKTASVGIKYIEIYPGQKLSKEKPDVKTTHAMSDAEIAEMKKIAADKGVTIVNYGVVGLGKDEASARKVFEFAKKAGIETIVTENPADTFPMLDKLAAEFKINIALHNHPKPSPYWDPEVVLKSIAGCSPRIGSCSDTGHWMRSGLDPLECLKKLKGHTISLHFKDLHKMGTGDKAKDKADAPHDVPWGTGAGNAKALLAELHAQGFKGVFSIEYEHNWETSVPEIGQCADFFYATAAELAKAAK